MIGCGTVVVSQVGADVSEVDVSDVNVDTNDGGW